MNKVYKYLINILPTLLIIILYIYFIFIVILYSSETLHLAAPSDNSPVLTEEEYQRLRAIQLEAELTENKEIIEAIKEVDRRIISELETKIEELKKSLEETEEFSDEEPQNEEPQNEEPKNEEPKNEEPEQK
jgi:predicted RND superfamily exporter protein